MEHKLIDGGEQWLPFARSRIAALKAGPLTYAEQWYTMPDAASVRVRIAGQFEYIEITSNPYDILSGLIRKGDVVNGKLVEYRPTEQAWEYVLNKKDGTSPGAFHEEARLGIPYQYGPAVGPTYFSGEMCKVVQFILGYGKPKSGPDAKEGVKLLYDYRYDKCHGLTKDNKDVWWLVEISREDGVRIMKLPLQPGSNRLANSKQDALRVACERWNGLPSGKTFPTGDALVAAVNNRRVLQLLRADQMTEFWEGQEYSPMLGWSFNPNGSEAHNCCQKRNYPTPGEVSGFHYKLDINISIANDGSTVASATLSKVSEGKLRQRWIQGLPQQLLYGAQFFQFSRFDPITYSDTPFPLDQVTDPVTIFVCHDKDGVRQEVQYILDTTLNGASSTFKCQAYDRPSGKVDPYAGQLVSKSFSDFPVEVSYWQERSIEEYPINTGTAVELRTRVATEVYRTNYTFSTYVYRQIFYMMPGFRDGFSIVTILPEYALKSSVFEWIPFRPGPPSISDYPDLLINTRTGPSSFKLEWYLQGRGTETVTIEPTVVEQFCLPMPAPEVDTDTFLGNIQFVQFYPRASMFGPTESYMINKNFSADMKYVGPITDLEPYETPLPTDIRNYTFIGYI